MKNIIQVDQLNSWLEGDNVVVIDTRANLQDKHLGRKLYETAHIPGAYFLDLEKDLSSDVRAHGGNHPLPDMTEFAEKLGHFGITEDTKVVVYDTANDMFAARAWWLIQYAGHAKTYVLDGGFEAWQAKGLEMSTSLPEQHDVTFKLDIQSDWTRSMTEVKNREHAVLIDSRANARYLGQVEPLYAKAGHIPGAVNYFWKDVLDDSGQWKKQADLEKHFEALDKDQPIIVSCGSGVSACPNIIALKEAGFKNVKLYPGSYSDWISYEENIVNQGDES